MKRSNIRRTSSNPRQKGLRYTQDIVNAMIRARDEGQGCITCESGRTTDAGHFRISECTPTRYHPYNLNGQCGQCNRFSGALTYEYSKALDKKWGKGMANFLDRLSRKLETFSIEELGTLRAAARQGFPVYEQMYFALRPHHKLSRLLQKAA